MQSVFTLESDAKHHIIIGGEIHHGVKFSRKLKSFSLSLFIRFGVCLGRAKMQTLAGWSCDYCAVDEEDEGQEE